LRGVSAGDLVHYSTTRGAEFEIGCRATNASKRSAVNDVQSALVDIERSLADGFAQSRM
jgi:hypothetical protein